MLTNLCNVVGVASLLVSPLEVVYLREIERENLEVTFFVSTLDDLEVDEGS